MKKTLKPQRQQISKQAYTIAKSVTVVDPKLKETQSTGDLSQLITNQQSEEEIMGETGAGNKSGAMEKNLNQMVNVLNARLKSLEDVVSTRINLCHEDLLPNSTKTTKTHAPKISDESDEAIPRSLRDTKTTSSYHKDNLVSSDTVFIDPYHLVLKTKQSTEAAKQLEQNLEESFGNINLREMKSKKAKKTMNQSEKSKKSEQLKNEAKRINRNKIEKSLQIIMDNFVTRSVMDPDKNFKAPERVTDEADWPISVKWSKRDPNFHNVDNNEGEFDPDLLLRYGLERINLPSGKKLFSWLIRQPIIQRYFISLFWLIKVKFFETDNSDGEAYLLRQMSLQYRSIVESLAMRAHAEHEKDFAFKYLPFILANSIHFAFHFMFPGSRHIYTKGFKKTIYMQVIQVMHGVQLCPMSVKVSWIKLFPEDTHEDGEEGEEGGEMFPVQIALKEPKFGTEYAEKLAATAALNAANDDDITIGSEHTNNTSKGTLPPIRLTNSAPAASASTATGGAHGIAASGFRSKFGGRLAGDEGVTLQAEDKRAVVRKTGLHLYQHTTAGVTPTNANTSAGTTPIAGGGGTSAAGGGSAVAAAGGAAALAASASAPNLGRRQSTLLKRMKSSSSIFTVAASDHNTVDDNKSVHSTHSLQQLIDAANAMNGTQDTGATSHKDKTVLSNFFEERTTQDNLLKTFLKPPLERPKHKFTVKRQNNIEHMNAQLVSPQIQLYLVGMESAAAPGLNRVTQTFRRTVPITWCATGGTDTHHKRVVQTELQTEVSNKLKQSESEFKKQTSKFHRLRCDELQEIDTAIDKVLSSGATNISRYSLDIRRQRNANNGEAPTDVTTAMAPTEMTLAEAQQLAMFDDDDLERFIREL